MTDRPMRPYQAKAIADLRDALRSGSKRPLLMAPTGAGKSRIAAEIINGATAKGKRVTFTVPAISLVDQTARMFYDEGIRDVGVMQANHVMTDPSKPVQIASVQTLRRRAIPPCDLWLIDEAHRLDRGISELMGEIEWAATPFIGLSATPWTKGLGRLYDRLIVATTTAELIEAGYLSPFRVFAPAHPDLSGVKITAGDYQQDQLSEAMRKGALVADIVETWLRLGEGRPTLCFAVDCAHAQAIQRDFEAANVACGYQDARTTPLEREEIRKAFERGDLQVVCNVGTLTTGIDWDVRCIILARPTKSEMLYVQIIGRGLRTAKGKADCLILDHSDTTLRLGFVTDILHDRLDAGRMASGNSDEDDVKPRLPKECPSCAFLKPVGVKVCPNCGFETQAQSQVEVLRGEVVELTSRRTAKANRETSWDEKAAFIAGLRRFQIATGKREGWVAHNYKDRFGVWPNDPRVAYEPPSAVVPEIVSAWIRHKNIAWAKGNNRAAG